MRKLSFIVFLIILYSGGWFAGASYLEKKVSMFQITQQQKFRELSYKNFAIKGFPFRYEIHFEDLLFKGPIRNLGLDIGGDLNISYSSPKCVIAVKLWNWHTFSVTTAENNKLDLTREAHPGFTLHFQQLKGKIFLNHHRCLTQFSLDILQPILADSANISILQAQQSIIDFRRAHQITANDRTAVDKIDCIFDQLNVLSKTSMQRVQLRCNIVNPFSRGPLLRGLKIWRDDGGVLEIPELNINWKNTTLKFSGTMSLDEDLRPLAGMTVVVNDYVPILDAFIAEKWLKPKQALAANVALTLLKKSGTNSIEIPLSIQDGTVSIGPLIFAPIPSLEAMLKI